ncbi:hypothetical protein N8367_01010 [Amylibacter sp.]|nr:hypothetical protein [Amylibacter sp.]
MFVSSPLYSNEFTYHCDSEDMLTSMVFDINTIEQTVIHTHSIDKLGKSIYNINKNREIYKWDKENDSVWLTDYFVFFGTPPSLTILLLNFERQKLFVQKMYNVLPSSLDFFKTDSPFRNETYDCYTME